jgi:hypothetical protein
VYLAWLLRDASGAEYMKQARENGLAVGFVSITERKSVVDWLEGRVNDLPSIVPIVCRCRTFAQSECPDSRQYSRIYDAAWFPPAWCSGGAAVYSSCLKDSGRNELSFKEEICC